MISIPGGTFVMGSNAHYPEEAPEREVRVAPFWMDVDPVTNRAFAQFVAATGYVTECELAPDPALYPDMDPALAAPASAVFWPPEIPTASERITDWWRLEVGACWRRPLGGESGLDGLEDHPVVHVTFADALAYAAWAGKSLPTESQWEFAARGGLDRADYAWGQVFEPGGIPMANYWHGRFPWENLLEDGFLRTSPVGAFPPNGYGLRDMIGNVWEWTMDAFDEPPPAACCAPSAPTAAPERKVLKGGSHLCAPNYCRRYRPAARYPQPTDTSTSHVGFRCVVPAPILRPGVHGAVDVSSGAW